MEEAQNLTPPPVSKNKSLIFLPIILLVAVLSSVLVYFWQQSRLTELERKLALQQQQIQSFQQEIKTPSPTNTSMEDVGASSAAESTLVNFFNYVNSGDYETAVSLLYLPQSDWEFMGGFAPEDLLSDKESILKQYCEAVGTCLRAKPVKVTEVTENEYVITTQFLKNDGSIFVFGPCCGATEEEMPSKQEFEYSIKKINNEFKVTNPPQYVP